MSGDDAVQHNQGAGEGQATPVSPAGHDVEGPYPVSLGPIGALWMEGYHHGVRDAMRLVRQNIERFGPLDAGMVVLLEGVATETLTKMAPSHRMDTNQTCARVDCRGGAGCDGSCGDPGA
jgi:hypothetical protein